MQDDECTSDWLTPIQSSLRELFGHIAMPAALVVVLTMAFPSLSLIVRTEDYRVQLLLRDQSDHALLAADASLRANVVVARSASHTFHSPHPLTPDWQEPPTRHRRTDLRVSVRRGHELVVQSWSSQGLLVDTVVCSSVRHPRKSERELTTHPAWEIANSLWDQTGEVGACETIASAHAPARTVEARLSELLSLTRQLAIPTVCITSATTVMAPVLERCDVIFPANHHTVTPDWHFMQLGTAPESGVVIAMTWPVDTHAMCQLPKNMAVFQLEQRLSLSFAKAGDLCIAGRRSLPSPAPSLRRPRLLLVSHVFNEEFLLPFFIDHHADMFDAAVIIDYNSTDRSVQLIRSLAPKTWRIVPSRTERFDADACDEQVMDIEDSYPGWWKIALTVTEFLVHPSLHAFLHARTSNEILRFRSFLVVGNDSQPVDLKRSLVQQRHLVSFKTEMPMIAYASMRVSRFMHKLTGERVYRYGRHDVRKGLMWKWSNEGFILKYRWSPWPDILPRKTQIASRLPADNGSGAGWHHRLPIDEIQKERDLVFNQAHAVSVCCHSWLPNIDQCALAALALPVECTQFVSGWQ